MRISPLPDAWKQRYSIMLDIRQDLPFVKKNLLFDAPWQVSRYMQVHSLFVLHVSPHGARSSGSSLV